jgi:signal transduction histidine kinase/CheY-like chemotaxis protein
VLGPSASALRRRGRGRRRRTGAITSPQALRLALEAADEGLVVVGPDGEIAAHNGRALALLAPEGDPAADPAALLAQHLHCHPVGEPAHEGGSMRHHRPDCTETIAVDASRALEMRTTLLPAGGAVRVLRDVTERQGLQDRLATAELRAGAALAAKSAFLANVSHELRTPLNGLTGVISLLLEAGLPEPQRKYAELAADSADALLGVIGDVLDFAKLEAGRVELESAPLDPRRLAERTAALLGSEAAAKGIGLIVTAEASVPALVVGDPGRLRQVLLNLLANAIKFTEAGGVALHLSPSLGRTAPGLRVAVTDTGIGIPAEAQRRLFEPFAQADSSITRRYGGSGLGLAICRELVTLMGGEIGFASTERAGSSFWFEVPLPATDQPAPAKSATFLSPAVAERRAVLLVEDNPTNRLVARALLERDGHSVVERANGREAIAAVEGGRFDLVVMDLQMAEMDGLAAIRHIRALPSPVGHIPVIILTADARPEAAAACRQAGANQVLTKPIRGDSLARAVAACPAGPLPPEPQQHSLPGAPPAQCLEPAQLDELQRMLPAGRLAEFVTVFLENSAARIASLVAAVAADPAVAAREAHALRGACAMAGAVRLAALADELAASSRAGSETRSQSELRAAITAEAAAVRVALHSWLDRVTDAVA